MRTTVDLANELKEEAARFTHVSIAVGFESSTIFVSSADPDPLRRLNDAIEIGGQPIGMIGFQTDGSDGRVYSRLLSEHADDPHMQEYLRQLTRGFRSSLEAGGVRTSEPSAPEENEVSIERWIALAWKLLSGGG